MNAFVKDILEPIKRVLTFLVNIQSFWKFYQNYEYDGETIEFIIENYQKVLCNRTKLMSKPTYYANDVIAQIDNWYEEMGYEYAQKKQDYLKTEVSTHD